MKNKIFFGWDNTKKVLKDLYATCSNKDSYLSLKRVQGNTAVTVAISLTIFYVIYNTLKDKLDPLGFTIVTAPLFIMAGYNVTMTLKSKQVDNNINTDIK